jgi:hypothetical protein
MTTAQILLYSFFGCASTAAISFYYIITRSWSCPNSVRAIGAVSVVGAFALFIVCLGHPVRHSAIKPTDLQITKSRDMVLIQGVVDGQTFVETNTSAFFFNHVDDSAYEVIHETEASAFGLTTARRYVLRKKA